MEFSQKPIIGMIHLANGPEQAIQEIEIYQKEGLSGVIVENYHGTTKDVVKTLELIQQRNYAIAIGINILPNEFEKAFELAEKYNTKFIQLDHVAGKYREGTLNEAKYRKPKTTVLGGVWPKYYTPLPNSDLKQDLEAAMQRADAIVVTGAGTGKQTPTEKIQQFRSYTGNFPLIIGAGVTPENVKTQLSIANGAIVGSAFKPHGKTTNPIERTLVKELMGEVKKLQRE